MNFTFLVVVLLTALAFVGVVIALSRAISPRSYNLQKFEAFWLFPFQSSFPPGIRKAQN